MSLPDGHTPIYCVYLLSTPQDIVSTLALDTTSCVYGTEGRTGGGGSFDPWPVVDVVPRWTTCPASTRSRTDRRRAQDSAQPTHYSRRAHGGQMDRATAGRPTQGAQGRTEGDRDRGQDGRQRWTGGSAGRSQRAIGRADALTPATVAAGHEESPWTAWKRSQGRRVAGSVVGAVFDQIGRVTAEKPTQGVQFTP